MKTQERSRLYWYFSVPVLVSVVAGISWSYSQSPASGPSSQGGMAPAGGFAVSCLGYVDVEQGVTSLFPLQPGRVLEVLVREGDAVSQGQVLLRLDDRQARSRVEEAEAAQELAQTLHAQAGRLPDQHRSQVAQQRSAIKAVGLRISAARHLLTAKDNLFKGKFINVQELEAARDQVEELEVLHKIEMEKLKDLEAQTPTLAVQRAKREASMAKAKLDQARQGLEECTLKAPRAGTVLRIQASAGDILSGQTRQPVVLFCPDVQRIIRAEVDQEFAWKLKAGQAALIEDDVHPSSTWRGQVFRVSDWFMNRRSVLLEPTQFQDVRTVECLISLDAGQPPVRIGQRVKVRIFRAAR